MVIEDKYPDGTIEARFQGLIKDRAVLAPQLASVPVDAIRFIFLAGVSAMANSVNRQRAAETANEDPLTFLYHTDRGPVETFSEDRICEALSNLSERVRRLEGVIILKKD